jgi:membrane protein YdbS with pleckstrin-like domain
MSFPTKLLCPGEEIFLDSKPNWSLLFWPTTFTLAVLGGCVAAFVLWSKAPTYMGWVLLGCGVAALGYFWIRYLAWTTTSFVVTSQRIVYRTGVLRRTGREIPIGRVQDVTYHQTILERIVRAGSLTVESAGRHGQDPFPDITRPAEVQSLINRVVSQGAMGYAVDQRGTERLSEQSEEVSQPVTDPTPRAPAPPPPEPPAPVYAPPPVVHAPEYAAPQGYPLSPPSGPSVAQQMSELAELHRHGVITDAEYEQKRRELLDRL